jgi:hypothetical protein
MNAFTTWTIWSRWGGGPDAGAAATKLPSARVNHHSQGVASSTSRGLVLSGGAPNQLPHCEQQPGRAWGAARRLMALRRGGDYGGSYAAHQLTGAKATTADRDGSFLMVMVTRRTPHA